MNKASLDHENDEKLAKDYVERLTIVENYERGENGIHVLDYENPDDDIFTHTDSYGFKHETVVEKTLEREREDFKSNKRIAKWEAMRRGQNNFYSYRKSNPAKFVSRALKGVPMRIRSPLWMSMLVPEYPREVYNQCWDRAKLVSPHVRQIDLDVNRTFRDHDMFTRRYSKKQKELFRVLCAYSMYNEEVGYCQGMNQVAALLLMFIPSDEDAFWALHQLMVGDKYRMHGMFIEGFPKLMRFQQHLTDRIMKKNLSSLRNHFDNIGLYDTFYTTKWYMQCFLDRVPFSLCIKTWDMFILQGDRALTAMAYNLLKMHKKSLLKMNLEQCMDFFQFKLSQDVGMSDVDALKQYKISFDELFRSRLIDPKPPADSEIPKSEIGKCLSTQIQTYRDSILEFMARHEARVPPPNIRELVPNVPRRDTSDSIVNIDLHPERRHSSGKGARLDTGSRRSSRGQFDSAERELLSDETIDRPPSRVSSGRRKSSTGSNKKSHHKYYSGSKSDKAYPTDNDRTSIGSGPSPSRVVSPSNVRINGHLSGDDFHDIQPSTSSGQRHHQNQYQRGASTSSSTYATMVQESFSNNDHGGSSHFRQAGGRDTSFSTMDHHTPYTGMQQNDSYYENLDDQVGLRRLANGERIETVVSPNHYGKPVIRTNYTRFTQDVGTYSSDSTPTKGTHHYHTSTSPLGSRIGQVTEQLPKQPLIYTGANHVTHVQISSQDGSSGIRVSLNSPVDAISPPLSPNRRPIVSSSLKQTDI